MSRFHVCILSCRLHIKYTITITTIHALTLLLRASSVQCYVCFASAVLKKGKVEYNTNNNNNNNNDNSFYFTFLCHFCPRCQFCKLAWREWRSWKIFQHVANDRITPPHPCPSRAGEISEKHIEPEDSRTMPPHGKIWKGEEEKRQRIAQVVVYADLDERRYGRGGERVFNIISCYAGVWEFEEERQSTKTKESESLVLVLVLVLVAGAGAGSGSLAAPQPQGLTALLLAPWSEWSNRPAVWMDDLEAMSWHLISSPCPVICLLWIMLRDAACMPHAMGVSWHGLLVVVGVTNFCIMYRTWSWTTWTWAWWLTTIDGGGINRGSGGRVEDGVNF